MLKARQAVPLLVGLAIAAAVALAARIFITAGVPDQTTLMVAAVPLHPGEVLTADRVRPATAYVSPAIAGMLREEDLPAYEGGTVLMFVPQGAAIPRTAIMPPGDISATARIAGVLGGPDERLLTLEASDRILAPPFSRLRPGDCLDMVAFFRAPTEAAAATPAPLAEEGLGGRPAPTPAPALTGTAPLTGTVVRPAAKWVARVVVRSVLGIPAPSTAETTAAAAGATAPTSPRLLIAVPADAVEGVVYALGNAEQIHLVVAPPCARAEVPASPGFGDPDLQKWLDAGRRAAGEPAFFLNGATPTPEGGKR